MSTIKANAIVDAAGTGAPTLTNGAVLPAGSAAAPAISPTGDTNTGVFFPAADTVAVTTGGTERMRVDSSGNLQFSGTGQRILGDFSNATEASRLLFQTTTANGNTVVGAIPNGSSVNSQFRAYNNSDPTNASQISVVAASGETSIRSGIIGTGTYLPMTFYTSGSERMRIDASGNVGIGTTSPAYKLDVSGSIGASGSVTIGTSGTYAAGSIYSDTNWGMIFRAKQASPALAEFKWGNSADTERMRINTSGQLLVGTASAFDTVSFLTSQFYGGCATFQNTALASSQVSFFNTNGRVGFISTTGSATTYSTSSDYRLKENVQPMVGALGKIAQLNPVTYTWKSDGSDGQGFIAHELQAVIPDCVSGEKDATDADGNPQYQGVDTSFLVATLVKAVQELTARIAALEAK